MKENANYALRVFLLSLRQILRRPQTYVALLFPLLIAALFRLLPPEEIATPVKVGVAVRDETGAEFQELIASYGGAVVSFCPTDVETLEKNVSLARWDCGLIVEADFDSRLQTLDTDGIITLVTAESSVVYPLVREAAAACIAQLITPYLADDYLENEGMGSIGDLPPIERVDIRLEVLDGEALEVEQVVGSIWSKLLLGALTAAAAVYVLMIASDLGRWLDGAAGRMERRLRGAALCTLPRLLATLTPAALGLALAAAATPTDGVLAESLGMLAFLGALALLLCRRSAFWKPLPLIIPLACPAALLYALMPGRLPWWVWFSGAALLTLLLIWIDREASPKTR